MFDIPLLYEDSDILAVNKPAGVSVHGDGRTKEETLVDWIVVHHPEMREVGEPPFVQNGAEIFRPGLVHRLDKETSGVLVLAKNNAAHLFLKRQFQERLVSKRYRALVYGFLERDDGVVDAPIGKSGSDFRLRTTIRPRGILRDAITYYRVLERFRSTSRLGFDATYLEVLPKTGRTHQIRVHLKALGYPVLCDALYVPKKTCPPEMGRLALHALSLELTAPSGKQLSFEAPLPEDMERTLALFRKS